MAATLEGAPVIGEAITRMVPIEIIDSTGKPVYGTLSHRSGAGLRNSGEGADGRRRRTLDKGMDQ